MSTRNDTFKASIGRQISLNKARTPSDRLAALCDLLDAVRAMAPRSPVACQRRQRALVARKRYREQLRAQFRRILATRRADAASGI